MYVSDFWNIFEAKAREYFLVPATEVPETVQLVFSMELLTIYSICEVRSEHKVILELPEDLQRVFEQ